MKKLILFALALCALAAQARAQTPETPAAADTPPLPPALKAVIEKKPQPGSKTEALQTIPDEIFYRELKDVDGASFMLSAYRGRVFVVNLWATWCGPCRKEIPGLNRLAEEFAPRGVEFVGLTTENPETDSAKVRDFAREFEVKYKLAWADRETALVLLAGNYSIPQTLVIAPDGHVVVRFRGYSEHVTKMLRNAVETTLDPSYVPPPEPPARPAAAAPEPTQRPRRAVGDGPPL